MAEDVAEATDSLPKETGLVGLDRPLDQLDLTKMLAESIGTEEQDRSEETSPSGDAVEEAEPVEESTEEAGDTEHVLSQEESETESDAEAEPAEQEPEWLQRRIDRFTRKLRLAEEVQFLLGLAAVFASYHQRKAWLGGIDSCVLSYFSGILQ